jgi:3-oxoacid CoA-transferase subunit A
MIYITGDTHSNFHDVVMFALRNNTKRSDVLIILGDAGINYCADERDIELKKQLHKLPITLFCIHGNHEIRPETISTYEEAERFGGKVYIEKAYPYLMFAKDGEIYNFNGRKCIVIGGAYSVDKYQRTENLSWWADEQPSKVIKKRVESKLDSVNWQVDAVFSHTCPSKYVPYECFLNFIDQSTVDRSTEEWLDEIENKLIYKEWYCGHWHTDKRDAKMLFFYRQYREIFRFPNIYERNNYDNI